MKSTGPFKIRKIAVKDYGCHCATFLVECYLKGRRVRKKFQRHDEAIGEQASLDIESGKSDAALRVAPTRLSATEIAEAEFCFRRLGEAATTRQFSRMDTNPEPRTRSVCDRPWDLDLRPRLADN
jgi:hypothetical protein